MHANWCFLTEISMETGMLNFWLGLLVTALTKETYFSNQDAQRKKLYFVNWECRPSNIKKCAPKLSFLNEKINIRKIQMVLEIENWLWKSFFRQFLAVWCYVHSQNTLAESHFLISFLLRMGSLAASFK